MMAPTLNGFLARTTAMEKSLPVTLQVASPVCAGTLVAFATSPSQVAYDGSGEHSPFASALLAHMGETNVSITEAMNRVTADVFKATAGKQRPWINVSLTTEVVLHKIDLNAPLIVGEATAPQPEGGSEVRNATANPSGSGDDAQLALNVLRQKIPKLASDDPIFFNHPIDFGDPEIDGKSIAELIKSKGMVHFVETYGVGPQRVQLEIKDPRAFAEYLRQFKEHSALGAINTLLGVQCRRPSFYDLTAEMARMEVPALIMSGDEEEPCIEVNLLMKRTIPGAALALLPRSGHAINLEEPALFNQLLEEFLRQVEAGRYTKRDKRSTVPSIYGPSGKP